MKQNNSLISFKDPDFINSVNNSLVGKSPEQILEFVLNNTNSYMPLVTTNFSPYEAVILHMVTQIAPDICVLWIDSGYNLKPTYQFAEKLITDLKLNIKVYTPQITAERQNSVYGGIPAIEESDEKEGIINKAHEQFTDDFKLQPFKKAMSELSPDIWITAVRREQTEFRQNMDVLTLVENNCLKVSPLLDWNEQQMEEYLKKHNLPNEMHYFDPTKALANRECGLHTKL